MGQNPAVGGQNASFQRQALAKLDWLVVRDLYETETASFWKDSPEVDSGKLKPRGHPDRGLLPARRRRRRDGRQLHQHAAAGAVARQGRRSARRCPLRHLVHLPPGPAAEGAVRATASEKRDRPIQALVWDYLDDEGNRGLAHQGRAVGRADPEGDQRLLHCRRSQGQAARRRSPTSRTTARPPAAPGFTPASSLRPRSSPTGTIAPPTARATTGCRSAGASPGRPIAGIMYNRCSADPQGNPWAKEARLAREHSPSRRASAARLRLLGRRARRSGSASTCPTSRSTKAADTPRPSRTASASTPTTAPRPSS